MIEIITEHPRDLLKKINDAIESGSIETWIIDRDGDYSPVQEQWFGKAWVRPVLKTDQPNSLYFGILESRQHRMTKAVYGVFLGRFAEMLLTHFDTEMKSLCISPLLISDIDVFIKHQ